MKKLGTIIALVFLFSVFPGLIGCAKAPAAPATPTTPAPAATQTPALPPTPAAKVKPIKLKLSSGSPVVHTSSPAIRFFAEEVTKRSGGRLIVEPYFGASLYSHWEAVDAVSAGAVEMAYSSWSHWTGRNIAASFPIYWGVLTSVDDFLKVQDKLEPILVRMLQEQSVKPVFYIDNGPEGILSRVPITKVEDANGLRIRGATLVQVEAIAALRATPLQMDVAEVYDALAKKAIDGTQTSVASMWSRKFYEVGKYIVQPLSNEVWFVYINLDTWNKLPKDMQELITQVGNEAWKLSMESGKKTVADYLEKLKGVTTVTTLTSDTVKPWFQAMQPVYDNYLKASAAKGKGPEAYAQELFEVFKSIR